MSEIETDTIDPRPVIKMLFGEVPDFVTYDPEFSEGNPVSCGSRHDGTFLFSMEMKEKINATIGQLIILAKLQGWSKLTLSEITRTTEFRGLYFSKKDENSGMVERWSFAWKEEMPEPDYSNYVGEDEWDFVITANDLAGKR